MILILTAFGSGRAAGLAPDASGSPVPEASRQLVLVLTAGPDATTGRLAHFERADADSAWKPVGASWPIVVGRTGLAAGLGLHREAVRGFPPSARATARAPPGSSRSRGRSDLPPRLPKAAFPIFASPLRPSVWTIRIRAFTRRSSNERTSRNPTGAPRSECERIPDYEWGVVVSHNPERLPSEGSCIFLHAWSGPTSPTAGCTAMELEHIRQLVAWLQADAAPVLVQLTETAFEELREPWRLTDLP